MSCKNFDKGRGMARMGGEMEEESLGKQSKRKERKEGRREDRLMARWRGQQGLGLGDMMEEEEDIVSESYLRLQ